MPKIIIDYDEYKRLIDLEEEISENPTDKNIMSNGLGYYIKTLSNIYQLGLTEKVLFDVLQSLNSNDACPYHYEIIEDLPRQTIRLDIDLKVNKSEKEED